MIKNCYLTKIFFEQEVIKGKKIIAIVKRNLQTHDQIMFQP